jgi:hypothetical protein
LKTKKNRTMSFCVLAQLENVPTEYWAAGGAVAVLLVIVFLVRAFRRRRGPAMPPPLNLTIDVGELGERGPPPGQLSLELYNIPVRLAALILAPAGRGALLPERLDVHRVAEQLVPGLGRIVEQHQTRIYRWPAQLSAQGFSNTLFANVRLPGDRGRGTPWSVLAGRFEAGDENLLAGVVVCAATPNSLGQFAIERPGQWLDLLRIRST